MTPHCLVSLRLIHVKNCMLFRRSSTCDSRLETTSGVGCCHRKLHIGATSSVFVPSDHKNDLEWSRVNGPMRPVRLNRDLTRQHCFNGTWFTRHTSMSLKEHNVSVWSCAVLITSYIEVCNRHLAKTNRMIYAWHGLQAAFQISEYTLL